MPFFLSFNLLCKLKTFFVNFFPKNDQTNLFANLFANRGETYWVCCTSYILYMPPQNKIIIINNDVKMVI